MTPPWPDGLFLITVTIIGVLGLAIGSFLNVVIYRVPIGMSLSFPPSSCPRCHSAILARDNIPVVSWLLLGGRCRSCRTRISARYPLVELGTALAFVAVALRLLPDADRGDVHTPAAFLILGAFLYLAAVSVALALIDLDVQRLPNAIVLPGYLVGGALLGAATLVSGDVGALIRAGIGLAALWLAYLAMALIYPGGMGFGDVKLAGLLGLFLGYLGWGELAVGAFAAFLLGGVFALGLVLSRRAGRRSGIPFGPWMLAGAAVGIFFGIPIWGGYLGILGLV